MAEYVFAMQMLVIASGAGFVAALVWLILTIRNGGLK